MEETATNKGHIIHGNFMDFFVGFWDGFEVVIEGITNPPQIKITIMVMWDAIVARSASFIRGLFT